MINLLVADQLMQNPRTYATALLWLLSELFDASPKSATWTNPSSSSSSTKLTSLRRHPKASRDKIEQVVRLIRSKGVGVYSSPKPAQHPETVLGQLGSRVQHALRAFLHATKAVKSAAETFRQNPKLDVAEVITQLGVGEALVSLLDERGEPGIVQRALIAPPHSQLPPITPAERKAIIETSLLFGTYETAIDRESAAEKLQARAAQVAARQGAGSGADAAPRPLPPVAGTPTSAGGGAGDYLKDLIFGSTGPRGGRREGMIESVAKSTARSMAGTVGREIMRGVLGSLFGGKRR